ncbi:MAG: DUF4876 domain-containing protein [Bacteroidales bacterium]|nr:DUF4876 domain-containing protein [Bacteroidales bacterium]
MTLIVLPIYSCVSKNDIEAIGEIRINVNLPNDFNSTSGLVGKQVMLKNRYEKTFYTAITNSDGVAVFNNIVQGIYDLSVAVEMSNNEFKQIAPEAAYNISSDIVLNGTTEGLRILDNKQTSFEQNLVWAIKGDLIISKLYYTGCRNESNKSYQNDRYTTIYNNSDKVVYLDKLCLASLWGSPNGTIPNYFYQTDKDNVYASWIAQFPGDGDDYPLNPGESIVVAQSALNHKADIPRSVDLSNVEWETYWADANKDVDNPDVPNLDIIYFSTPKSADVSYSVYGPAVVIFKNDDVSSFPVVNEPNKTMFFSKIPVTCIIDAVDCLKDDNQIIMKRLPLLLDASYTSAYASYIGASVERGVSYITSDGRKILKDTNNSFADFVLVSPREDGTSDHLDPYSNDKPELYK